MSRKEKAELRRQCRRVRDAIPANVVEKNSAAVWAHLSEWITFQEATTILTFLAFRNEIDLSPLFERWPDKRWLVPRVIDGDELMPTQKPHLRLHPYDRTRLVRHRFGMLEPEPNLPVVDPHEVGLVLVPGVAFDLQGGRLGFGGGFYDRLLPLADLATRVGVTYERLVVDAIPMESWDCRVEWLVTPDRLIRTAENRG